MKKILSKTQILKKTLVWGKAAICLALSMAIVSCGGEENPQLPFSNPNDFTTTGLETNIPRIEVLKVGNTIRVYLSITDQEGNPLSGFNIKNFQIMEVVDGDTLVKSANLLNNGDEDISEPLAISANMDYSGSMFDQDIQDMENALKTFVKLKEAGDLISIIKFASYVERVQDFTNDTSLLLSKIDEYAYVGELTAFYDACDLGLDDLEGLSGNYLPVVVGFTDGYNNASYQSFDGLISKATDYEIPIYNIGFGSADHTSLTAISEATGGRYFYAISGDEIADLYLLLKDQLKKLYVFQWPLNADHSGTVQVVIKVEYTGGNGDFTDTAVKYYTVN